MCCYSWLLHDLIPDSELSFLFREMPLSPLPPTQIKLYKVESTLQMHLSMSRDKADIERYREIRLWLVIKFPLSVCKNARQKSSVDMEIVISGIGDRYHTACVFVVCFFSLWVNDECQTETFSGCFFHFFFLFSLQLLLASGQTLDHACMKTSDPPLLIGASPS